MVKYKLRHTRTLEPMEITVDESAIDDFCEMMGWTRLEFINSTIKVDDCD